MSQTTVLYCYHISVVCYNYVTSSELKCQNIDGIAFICSLYMSHSPELPIAIPRSLKTCVSLFLAEVFQGINLLPGYFEQVRFS